MAAAEICCICCEKPNFGTVAAAAAHFESMEHMEKGWSAFNAGDCEYSVHINGEITQEFAQLSATQLLKFFSSYGPIHNFVAAAMRNGEPGFANANIQFNKSESVDESHGRRNIDGVFVRVRRYRHSPMPELPEPNQIMEKLLLLNSTDEQMEELVRIVQLTPQEVDQREKLRLKIKNILRGTRRIIDVHSFSSAVSGLGFTGSFLHLYVQMDSILGEPLQIERTNANRAFRELRRQQKRDGNSKDYYLIPKVLDVDEPNIIDKYTGRETNIICVLSFDNMQSVRNTQFIRTVCLGSGCDPRVRPLTMTVLYWAEIKLSHESDDKLTSYALTLLVFFYLQNKNILHSVKAFQDAKEEEERILGWNFAFCEDLSLLPKLPKQNPMSMSELLSGFFSFYADFDFEHQVVCPYLGKPVSKTCFEGGQLPPDMEEYTRRLNEPDVQQPLQVDSVLVLQDPFVLNMSVAKLYSARSLRQFQQQCRVSAELTLLTDVLAAPQAEMTV